MRTAALALLALASLAGPLQAKDLTLRAGELLLCTLEEPRFSSAAAQVGEPTVCYLGQLREFGHAAFPRGSYVTGRLADSREPGRITGKGWLDIQFDRLILPRYRTSHFHTSSLSPRIQDRQRRPYPRARASYERRNRLVYSHSLAGRPPAPARAGAAPGAEG